MTIRALLNQSASSLSRSESPWLDATILLCFILKIRKEKLLASFPDKVDSKVIEQMKNLITEREKGYPVAYLIGKKEFFGRDFFVQEGILCPRADTEVLVEEALSLIDSRGYLKVLDLCTGSGCIGLTLALERPEIRVLAGDISKTSQGVFKRNKENLQANNIDFILSSLFQNIEDKFDLIATNPPYLTTQETDDRMNDHWQEPALALDGGSDGLDLIREIIHKSPSFLNKGGTLIIEADPAQMETMEKLLRIRGFSNIEIILDLAGLKRHIKGEWI